VVIECLSFGFKTISEHFGGAVRTAIVASAALRACSDALSRFGASADRFISLSLAALFGFLASAAVAIPTSERNFLLALYSSTNGANWTNKSGWSSAMINTECTWFGITCNAGNANVTRIDLSANNLVGTLPSTLNDLTQLEVFSLSNNTLSGSIPSLAGLGSLRTLSLSTNAFTGSIPTFTGLTALSTVGLHNNQLTGSMPALSGSTQLNFFTAYNNLLSGALPSLSGLTNLQYFYVDRNQFTGAIPSLSGLIKLEVFYVQENQLTGSLPSLSGLPMLQYFYAYDNQLSGSIPAFTNQTTLQFYDVSANQLSGAIPSLAGVAALRSFRVHGNQLTGAVPAVPTPINLLNAGGSRLCPNPLTPSVDSAWDAATGSTPWSVGCGTPFSVSQTSSLDFGAVGIGAASASQNVVLANTSSVAGSLLSCAFSGSNAGEFLYEAPAPTFPIALSAGQTASISVYALPLSTGNKNASFTCTPSAFGTMVGGPTALIASSPVPTVSQTASLAFNTVTVGNTSSTLNVVLTNTSAVTARIAGCIIGGTNAADFAFAQTPIFPMFIGANSSRNILMQVSPTSAGAKTASLTCTPQAPTTVSGGPTTMTATGDATPANITQSGSFAFGSVILGASPARNITFTNSAVAGSVASCTFSGGASSAFAFSPPPSFPIALSANQVISFPIVVSATTTGFKSEFISCTATAPGIVSGAPTALSANVATVSQTATLNFGTVAVSVPSPIQNVVLVNSLSTSATIQTCTFSGADADQFAFSPAPNFPIVLSANGGASSIGVRIVATSPGEKLAQVVCAGATFDVVTTNATQLTSSTDRGCLDADGDGQILPHTDLLILSRAARGLTGSAVTNGAIVGTPPRNTWVLIRSYLNARCNTNYAP
jgi:Leucine-rich repeat (LRR) protein